MIQPIIVAIIVACAAFAVLRRYAPKALKRVARVGTVRLIRSFGWNSMADKLAQHAESGAACGDGCGSCGNCGPASTGQGGTSQSILVSDLKQTLRKQNHHIEP